MKIPSVLFAVSLASALGSEASLSRRHRRSHRLRWSQAPSAAPSSSPVAANPPPLEPAFGAAEFGPKECVTTWPNSNGQCMIETNCDARDIQDFDFAIDCVDSSGGSVVHSFGRGSFRAKETFNTLTSCEECRPAAGGSSAKAAVLSLENVVSTLKGQMASMQKQLATLETEVHAPAAVAPPAVALSAKATGDGMDNSEDVEESESAPQEHTEQLRRPRPTAGPVPVVMRRGQPQLLADERKQWEQEEQEQARIAEKQREQDEAHEREQDEDDEQANAALASGVSEEEPARECGGPDEPCEDGLDHRDLYQKEQDAIRAAQPGHQRQQWLLHRRPARQHYAPTASPTSTRRGVRGFTKKQRRWHRRHKAIGARHRKLEREREAADQNTEGSDEAPLPSEHVLVHRRARRAQDRAVEDDAQADGSDAKQAETSQALVAQSFAGEGEAQGTEDLSAEPQPQAHAEREAEPEAAAQPSAYETAPEPEGEMSAAFQEVPADES